MKLPKFKPISASARRTTVIGISILIFSYHLLAFERPHLSYWDTYLVAAATFMTDSPAHFKGLKGTAPKTYKLKGVLPDDLVNYNTYGIISKDRQLGESITLAPFYKFFGRFGFRLFFALVAMFIFIFGYILARELLGRRFLVQLVTGILLSVNPYSLTINRLNSNVLALMLSLMLLFLLLRRAPEKPWYLLGLLYGILGGIKNETIVFGPAILYLVLSNPDFAFKRRCLHLGKMVLGAALAISPILFWNSFAYGNPFIHPSQYSGLQDFKEAFPHGIFGMEFSFNGLLNFPFHDQVVRTPHFAFPTFMLFPLTVLKSFGAVLSAFVPIGLYFMWRRNRRQALFLLLWALPIYLLFAFQENWEEEKMSYILLVFAPLILYLAEGLNALFSRKHWKGALFSMVFLASAAVGLTRLLVDIDIPADKRWYERFPRAVKSQSGFKILPLTKRKDWEFFQTRETPKELERERERLCAGQLQPRLYLPLNFELNRAFKHLHEESTEPRIELFDLWPHIYSRNGMLKLPLDLAPGMPADQALQRLLRASGLKPPPALLIKPKQGKR